MELLIGLLVLAAGGLLWFARSNSSSPTAALPTAGPLPTAALPGAAPLQGAAPLRGAAQYPYGSAGAVWGVDPLLLRAIAQVESGEDPKAINPADPSYGLMQVLCRSSGLDSPCTNTFNVVGWEGMTPARLLTARSNLDIAAQILKYNLGRFGLTKAIAVYNDWSARVDPAQGPFRNQPYVDAVLAHYHALQGIGTVV